LTIYMFNKHLYTILFYLLHEWMDSHGPHTDGICGTTWGWQFWDHMPCQFCGPTRDDNSWDHMLWQFWDPNVMLYVGTLYRCQGDFIRLSVLRTTYHGNSGDHMYGNSGENMRGISLDHIPWQVLGKYTMAVFGPTYDGSCEYHILMAVLGNTCNHSSGDHRRYYFLENTHDGNYGDHIRCQYWEPRHILV